MKQSNLWDREESAYMNEIDRQFAALVAEIQGLSEKELYHRIRANFDQVPYAIQKSCMDFFNQFNYWGRLDPQQGIYEEIEGKGAALFHHIQDFAWLYDHLADYRSKKTLYAILNNWYRYDFITTAQTKESLFDDYFDLDLVTCTPEEVFVDLGAYTGDTVLSYLKTTGRTAISGSTAMRSRRRPSKSSRRPWRRTGTLCAARRVWGMPRGPYPW